MGIQDIIEGKKQWRAHVGKVVERNPNIRISAKVASNHGAILRKDFRAVADAVREVATLDRADR